MSNFSGTGKPDTDPKWWAARTYGVLSVVNSGAPEAFTAAELREIIASTVEMAPLEVVLDGTVVVGMASEIVTQGVNA